MSLVVTEAIVLHAFDYLESSRIIRLATRDAGLQSVLARGSRQPKSRFGHALDVFASGVVQFQARSGRDLHTLSGFELTKSRIALAHDLGRFSAAAALAELALAFAHGSGTEDDPLFDTLEQSLDALTRASGSDATDWGLAAAWKLVAELGFAPLIDACVVCHQDIRGDVPVTFSPAAGGVVCERCRRAMPPPPGRSLPPSARQALRAWSEGAVTPALGDAGERRAHVRLLREFLAAHVAEGRELPALASWESSIRVRP